METSRRQWQHIEPPTRPTAPFHQQEIQRHFQYTPLSNPSAQLRLFRIRPATRPNQPLRCVMTTHPLPCAPNTLYNAISYMWQPEHPYQTIRLNGRSHRIGFNLWRFLTKLSQAGETGLLWADALCIDQSNLQERNAQVAVMSQIYKNAHEVLCWVGGEDWGSRILLKRITSRKAMYWRSWDVRDERALARWEALKEFREREYWSRMWIIPEILSQPQSRIIIFCGDEAVTLERLHAVCDFALDELRTERRKLKEGRESPRLPPGWSENQLRKLENHIRGSEMLHLSHKCGHMELWDLLDRHGTARCSDPRDKVYALLSAAEDTTSLDCPLKPDYGKDVRVLVTDVLVFCGRQRIDCLEMLLARMLPGERMPRSYEQWARCYPPSIRLKKRP